MRTDLIPGTAVRVKLDDGTLGTHAVIECMRSFNADYPPGYAGEGRYFVQTIPDERHLILLGEELLTQAQIVQERNDQSDSYTNS